MKVTRRAFLGMALAAGAVLAGCRVPQSGILTASGTQDLYRATPLSPEDADGTTVVRSEDEWRELLAPLQFHVMREKGTERAFTGEYDDHKEEGLYHCSACGNPLFASDNKYDSGTGWPSFWAPMSETCVKTERDTSQGMVRTEVLCARCDSHLGHVFDDGPQPTGLRYCMNSVALNFVPQDNANLMLESQDDMYDQGEGLVDMGNSMTDDLLLYDFSNEATAGRWAIVNDGVMGGLSQSTIRLTEEGTALFVGTLSLENYGGFASVRTVPPTYNLDNYEGLVMRVRGDGRRYKLRLRTDRNLDGPAYEADFDTIADTWMVVRIAFRDTTPTFRGRRLTNMPALEGKQLAQIGLMIADKRAGDFRLEVAWIRAYRPMV